MWCLLNALKWQLEAIQAGQVPALKVDGTAWDDHESEMPPSSALSYKGLLLFIEGDLAEFVHTLGVQPWGSTFSPSSFCSLGFGRIARTRR